MSLGALGILGNNQRIRDYILPHNERRHYPLVDNKIKTAELLTKANIQMPELYFDVKSTGHAKLFHEKIKDLQNFVIKPAHGAMGNGIVIVNGLNWHEDPKETYFETTRKDKMKMPALMYHLSSILSGLYSINGQYDQAMIQELLKLDPFFEPITYKGIPDIRVIVFYGVPVMAMLRLPTKLSGGRGNLHQGAVGCGVDLITGELNHAVLNNKSVTKHPDTQEDLSGLVVPHWQETLLLAAQCSQVVDINYLGVDIVIDPIKGPLVLELNARPGLSIQIANNKGLLPRLEKINPSCIKEMSIEGKVKLSRELV